MTLHARQQGTDDDDSIEETDAGFWMTHDAQQPSLVASPVFERSVSIPSILGGGNYPNMAEVSRLVSIECIPSLTVPHSVRSHRHKVDGTRKIIKRFFVLFNRSYGAQDYSSITDSFIRTAEPGSVRSTKAECSGPLMIADPSIRWERDENSNSDEGKSCSWLTHDTRHPSLDDAIVLGRNEPNVESLGSPNLLSVDGTIRHPTLTHDTAFLNQNLDQLSRTANCGREPPRNDFPETKYARLDVPHPRVVQSPFPSVVRRLFQRDGAYNPTNIESGSSSSSFATNDTAGGSTMTKMTTTDLSSSRSTQERKSKSPPPSRHRRYRRHGYEDLVEPPSRACPPRRE